MANTSGINETINCPNGFYFGDPCYALNEKLYDKWCDWGSEREKTEGRYCNDGKFIHDGKEIMLADSTAYGDGCYDGSYFSYGVDAGCLAVIPLEFCDRRDLNELKEMGLVMKDYSGEVTLETDGDTGHFRVLWGMSVENVDTGEEENEDEDSEE